MNILSQLTQELLGELVADRMAAVNRAGSIWLEHQLPRDEFVRLMLEEAGPQFAPLQDVLEHQLELVVEQRLENEYWDPIISKHRAEVIAECRASGRGTAWMAKA